VIASLKLSRSVAVKNACCGWVMTASVPHSPDSWLGAYHAMDFRHWVQFSTIEHAAGCSTLGLPQGVYPRPRYQDRSVMRVGHRVRVLGFVSLCHSLTARLVGVSEGRPGGLEGLPSQRGPSTYSEMSKTWL